MSKEGRAGQNRIISLLAGTLGNKGHTILVLLTCGTEMPRLCIRALYGTWEPDMSFPNVWDRWDGSSAEVSVMGMEQSISRGKADE